MKNSTFQQPPDTATFLRIRKWYLLALAAIALTIVLAQILIQVHLDSQLDDSRVINVAGRQRAYSQKLVKEILLLEQIKEGQENWKLVRELDRTLAIWTASHHALQFGNDSMGLPVEDNRDILDLFERIEPHFLAMVKVAEDVRAQFGEGSQVVPQRFENDMTVLLGNEKIFLRLMDTIVNEYDQRSKLQLQNLKQKEYLLLVFSLLILLLEMLFIFRPLSTQIRKTIKDLMESQQRSDLHSREMEKLYAEKERSLQELQELNFVIDNAALFASTKNDGSVVFMSKKFIGLLGCGEAVVGKPLSELLTVDEGQQQYLKHLLQGKGGRIRSEEINIRTAHGGELWLDISIIPMLRTNLKQSVLILCSDITERRRTQQEVERLTKENYEERILQKQQQASLIVEGQEGERERIAKDIHDGIGQMLTALKFNIESINLAQPEKSAEKIAYLKVLASDLIKGVRTATFNLTPPELGDHGIFPALQKMTAELSRLTGKNILFENRSEGNIRFNSLAETNIYRVTQEAVNNAIKYAEANFILVTITFKENLLSVVINDDGKGFDGDLLEKSPKNASEGGMGLFFMKERMSYINGRLFISSHPGKGTRVTLNYRTSQESTSEQARKA